MVAARVKASEEKFVKLREVYSKLRNEHIQLLRTEGEGRKKLQVYTSFTGHTHKLHSSSPPPSLVLLLQAETKKVTETQKKLEKETGRVTQLRVELEEATTVYVHTPPKEGSHISSCIVLSM